MKLKKPPELYKHVRVTKMHIFGKSDDGIVTSLPKDKNADELESSLQFYKKFMVDSEESDGEGGLGNLNRLIVRPPGHSGKAKRGQLCFDAAFECGNLGRADHITELEYDLFIRPDTCRPRSRFWFNFTVENVKQDQRVIFNIVNFGKEHTLFDEDMTPLVRSTSRQKWQRIPRRLLFSHRSLAHRNRKILSLAFAFDREEDVYQFAAAAPYSYSRLQKYLAAWEKRAQAFATRESIAQTTQKRRVDLITIGDLSAKVTDLKEECVTKGKVGETKKRVVLIIARVHGGEQPASYICQGLLDYLLSSTEKASALRNGVVLQVIPMLNPDGVFLGNQRSDLLGSDLNRSWNRATSYAHPALIAVNDLVKKLTAEKSLQLDFVIDLHADVSQEGVFVRGNSYDDVYRFERHAVLPKFLAARIEAWKQETCHFNADGGVAGSARRSLSLGSVDSYTVLASMGGRRLSARGPYIHYTEDAYLKIGRCLVRALCDYYRHIGVIPPRIGLSKKKQTRGRKRRRRPLVERERKSKVYDGVSQRICRAGDLYDLCFEQTGTPSVHSAWLLNAAQKSYFQQDTPSSDISFMFQLCTIESPSSSPERRVLPPRVLSPALPPASPLALRVLPARLTRHHILRARPKTGTDVDHILPCITGTAVRTPRLTVVDLSAHIRTPPGLRHHWHRQRQELLKPKLARPPRPSHFRFTSDEYDTHESDS